MRHLALVKASQQPSGGEEKAARKGRVPEDMLKCSYRPPSADFYCWRFKLWYNTLDCAFRTQHHTFEGCARCAQGNFNLKARRRDLVVKRFLGGSPR